MKKLKTFSSFSVNENIEYEKRLTQPIIDILNQQIKNELESSQIYRGMSTWLDDKGYNEMSKYFFKSGQEELVHMDKIYNYLFDKNCKPIVPVVGQVKQEFKDVREVLEESLKHEIFITEALEKIANLSISEKDNTTYQFIQWFLNENVEEENKWKEILFKIDDMPKYQIDNTFKELNEK